MSRCASVPAELQNLAQWVAWRLGAPRADGKRAKVPYNPRTGRPAAVNAPRTWATFGETVAIAGEYDGIGIVLTADDPFTGFDLDHCRDLQSGTITPAAMEIVETLASYTEITPSGTGLRVFVRAVLPPGGRKRGELEMYDRDRFLTVTGLHLTGTPTAIEIRQREVQLIHAAIFRAARPHTPVDPPAGHDHDDVIRRRAMCAASGAQFAQLWSGYVDGYPSHSEADLALVSFLGRWTRDADQIDRLFRRSGLMRPKWDEPRGTETYGALTIARVLGRHAGGSTGGGAATPAAGT